MSLRSQAYSDFLAFIATDGDDVTLIAPDATEYEVKGQVIRRDAQVDPQTNVQVVEPMLAVSVSLNGLAEIPVSGWTVTTTDVLGNALTHRVRDHRIDRTIGFVSLILEDFDG